MVATTTTSPSKPLTILILGGGIAGLTLSLALTKFSPPNLPPPTIKIFEIRPQPATIGGAVNLTPNALRLLDHLGALSVMKKRGYGKVINAVEIFDIYSGVRLGESAFRGPNGEGIGEPPYKALRITRGDSLKAVLEVIETKENIELRCGMKTVEIEEQEGIDGGVTLRFENGEVVRGNLLIGCDGIHSVTRLTHVEPERKAVYSGIANAFGFAKNPALRSDDSKQAKEAKEAMQEIEPHFECTAMHFARRGMMLTSFFNEECEEVYVGALMQWPEVTSRDGWKAVGQETEKVRQEMRERFVEGAESGGGKLGSFLRPVVDEARDVFLWPVYTLSKEGRWSTERVMLLGDAAHAMPPQGESTGIVFEDAVLFARCVCRWQELNASTTSPIPVKEAFEAYEKLRRARIEAAFEESKSVVGVVNDAGWLGHKIKTNIVPWFLWWTRANREKHFIEDVTTSDLGY